MSADPVSTEGVEDAVWIPPVGVCAMCAEVYCDGVACYAALDPNDLADQPRIEEIQDWVRAGRALKIANKALDQAEGRR